MSSLNLCQFIGNIGKIETRFLSNGDAVTNFSIACNETWKDKNTGEKQEKTEWISCVTYRKLAQVMADYCAKGMQIYVSGKMETRKYTDKSGIEKYTTQIIVDEMRMLGSKSSNQDDKQSQSDRPQQSSQSGGGFDDFESDIPF